MQANKIILNGQVLIDLTQDTVAETDVVSGKTFHKADGTEAVGTYAPNIQPLEVTENGTYSVPTDQDGFNPITVNVQPDLQEKTTTENGAVFPDEGYDGLSKVNVNVQPELQSLEVTENGSFTPPDGVDGYNSVTVNVQGSGGGGSTSNATANEVTFYDYDGLVIAGYSISEARTLTELPTPPTHTGLTFQGWNYSLEEINTLNYATNIGATYITDDGKTRIYITLCEGRTSPKLGLIVNGTATVDWGDGTTPDTLTDTSSSIISYTSAHEYATAGDYIITIDVVGEAALGLAGSASGDSQILICSNGDYADTRNDAYRNAIKKIEIGNGIPIIYPYAFQRCYSLSSITIPESVTNIGNYVFSYCTSLSSITIPEGVTSIGNYAFYYCTSLSSITIPEGVTSIGNYAFSYCTSLSSITIPEGVTSIGASTFRYCYALSSITIPEGMTSIGDYAFQYCRSLSSITIPDSVTIMGNYVFQYCYALSSIRLPAGIKYINYYVFSYCTSLSSITIPEGVTSIGNYAFQYCYGMRIYDFSAFTSVPSLANSAAFNGIQSDCQILVPAALYDKWVSTSNWSNRASYIVAV